MVHLLIRPKRLVASLSAITSTTLSQYVPVEDIIAGGYNLDLCGFPHETVEILPPEEFIAHYLHEKNVISGRIENILGRISAAMNQEGAQ